jgi:hypothetical protein
MGKVTGFLEFPRLERAAEPPHARTAHWRECSIGTFRRSFSNALVEPPTLDARAKAVAR